MSTVARSLAARSLWWARSLATGEGSGGGVLGGSGSAYSLCSTAQTLHMEAEEVSHVLHSARTQTVMLLAAGAERVSRKVSSQKSHQRPVRWPQLMHAHICANVTQRSLWVGQSARWWAREQ